MTFVSRGPASALSVHGLYRCPFPSIPLNPSHKSTSAPQTNQKCSAPHLIRRLPPVSYLLLCLTGPLRRHASVLGASKSPGRSC